MTNRENCLHFLINFLLYVYKCMLEKIKINFPRYICISLKNFFSLKTITSNVAITYNFVPIIYRSTSIMNVTYFSYALRENQITTAT